MSAYTEPVPDAATLARGLRHVLVGVALVATPFVTLLALALAAGRALPFREVMALLLAWVLFVVALLSGSVVARWITFAFTCLLGMLSLPALAMGLASGQPMILAFGLVLAVMTAGLALTWVTRPARAWHAERDRRRAERRAHRTRRLADWRAGDPHPSHEPHA